MRLDIQDGVSLTHENSEANPSASLSQDWLDVADAEERAMRNLPRVVASLPEIGREGDKTKRKSARSSRGAWLRVASSYTATFLLGGVCVAFGARFFDSESDATTNEQTNETTAKSNLEEPGLSLDSLAFERPQETQRADVTSNDSPLRFNDVYDSYADGTTNETNAFAPQTDNLNGNADGLPQVAREEETFPTWADLESNENVVPSSNLEPTNDAYSFASSSSPTPYEAPQTNAPFPQNYAPTSNTPNPATYNANYAQNQNPGLPVSAPNAPQYASNVQYNNYNQNNGYADYNQQNNNAGYNQNTDYSGNTAINSNVNNGVYATNAGNTNYNSSRELDDFPTSNASNEGFGAYSMNASVASDVPVFEDRRSDGYGTTQNNYASSADGFGAPAQNVDRSSIPTFSAPNPTPTQAAPSSSDATYVAQNREEASTTAPVVSSGRPLRW